MITLRHGSLLHKLFLFPLTEQEKWEHESQTNFCFLFGILMVRLPAIVILSIMAAPIFGLSILGDTIGNAIKRRQGGKSIQLLSVLHGWWEAIHGRLCPIIRFE